MIENGTVTAQDVGLIWDQYLRSRDKKLRGQLIEHYFFLVKNVVHRMAPIYSQYCEYDDMVGYGILGLIDVIDKFDPSRNVKFESYAVSRIRGEILDNMRRQDWAPASLRAKIKRINSAYEEVEAQNDGQADEETVAKKLEMDVERLRQIQEQTYIFNVVSFESLMTKMSQDAYPSLNFIGGNPEDEPEAHLERQEMKKLLAQMIRALSENERIVIELYYYEGLRLKDIAKVLGLSESRISQIHSKVLSRLNGQLEAVLRDGTGKEGKKARRCAAKSM